MLSISNHNQRILTASFMVITVVSVLFAASGGVRAQSGSRTRSARISIALEGYCPVTLVHQRGWMQGDKRWGAQHQGQIYLFAGPQQQQQFLNKRDRTSAPL